MSARNELKYKPLAHYWQHSRRKSILHKQNVMVGCGHNMQQQEDAKVMHVTMTIKSKNKRNSKLETKRQVSQSALIIQVEERNCLSIGQMPRVFLVNTNIKCDVFNYKHFSAKIKIMV